MHASPCPVLKRDPLPLEASVLRTLAYFGVFGHPLKPEELLCYGDQAPTDAEGLAEALGSLKAQGLVEEHTGHWGLRGTRAAVARRMLSEARARARMPKALSMSRLIGRFPFVRGVFISGSMSKGCLAEDGDIDYFIITRAGRLWVARTLLVLYKRLVLFNSHRDFCVNYFIDEEHLAVEDRNRYTATEVVTLLPTYGNGVAAEFFRHNAWAYAMLPGMQAPASSLADRRGDRLKQRLERLLGGRSGRWLEQWCMRTTHARQRRRFGHMDAAAFDLAFRTRPYVSKHHPRNFQHNVMEAYVKSVAELEQRHGTPLQEAWHASW